MSDTAAASGADDKFGSAYYGRFYGSAPVHTKNRVGHLASAMCGLFGWWGLKLGTVLDIGAGPGYWRDWFAENRPRVMYRSIDLSAYASEEDACMARHAGYDRHLAKPVDAAQLLRHLVELLAH